MIVNLDQTQNPIGAGVLQPLYDSNPTDFINWHGKKEAETIASLKCSNLHIRASTMLINGEFDKSANVVFCPHDNAIHMLNKIHGKYPNIRFLVREQQPNFEMYPAWPKAHMIQDFSRIESTINSAQFVGVSYRPEPRALALILASQELRARIITRMKFHYNDNKTYMEELKNCIYSLCPRGIGNFSYRVYETMACGRIPIIIHDDCDESTLPSLYEIKWSDFAYLIDCKDLECGVFKHIKPENSLRKFSLARKAYINNLSPSAWIYRRLLI